MSIFHTIKKWFFGYDFFISYARKDCSEYALALSKEILDENYSCYIDQLGTTSSPSIPKKLIEKLKRSSILILLGSKEAAESEAINDEIIAFSETNRIVISIDFGFVNEAIWKENIVGIPVTKELVSNLSKASPSNEIVNRSINSINFIIQSKRILMSAIVAIILIVVSSIFSFNLSKSVDLLSNERDNLITNIYEKEDKFSDINQKYVHIQIDYNSISKNLNERIKQLSTTQEDLNNARTNLKITEEKVIGIEKKANEYLEIAKKREQSGFGLLNYFESELQGFYIQPNLYNELKCMVNEKVPIKIYFHSDYAKLEENSKLILNNYLILIKNKINENPNLLFHHAS